MSAGALDGIKVFEFASYVSGPFAGMLLSDLGAEVIKVETPDGGDPFRMWGKTDYNGTFGSMNRNKKSVTLDLKTKDGQAAARKLALTADVIIENFRSGAMERLGLGYDALAADNPRLIYCSITGFGSEGPYRSRPGYDTVGQAMSGLLAVLTDRKAPQPMGISLSDHLSGTFAAYGVLAALMARTHQRPRPEGRDLAAAGDTRVPRRERRELFRGRPGAVAGDAMPARAGVCLHRRRRAAVRGASVVAGKILAGPADGHRPGGIRRPTSASDPRDAGEELRCAVRRAHRGLPGQAARGLAQAARREDVPSGPLNTIDEVFADPQVMALDMRKGLPHRTRGTVSVVGNPVRLSATPPRVETAAPELGADNEALLR